MEGRERPARTAGGLFATSLLVGFSGALMPGPLLAAVAASAATRGFWSGPALVAGHGLLELALVLALALGLGRALRRPRVTRLVAAAGGITLMWLASGMIHDGLASRAVLDTAGRPPAMPGSPLVLGALVSAANPYWLLWWATVGTAYVSRSIVLGPAGLAAFYTGHVLSDLSWYSLVALAVASGRTVLGAGVYNVVVTIAGIFLAVMGLLFLLAAARARSRLSVLAEGAP